MTIRYMDVPLAPDWMQIAVGFLAKMTAEGAILADRPGLTGFEWGVFALEGDGLESKPVGMSIYYQPEGHDLVWLDLLYVEPSHRRQGIAKALIERTAAAATAWGVSHLDLGALCHNTPMYALAERCGFAKSAVVFALPVKAVPA